MGWKFIKDTDQLSRTEFIESQFRYFLILRKSPEVYLLVCERNNGQTINQYIKIALISRRDKEWGYKFLTEMDNPNYHNISPRNIEKHPLIINGKTLQSKWREQVKVTYNEKWYDARLERGVRIKLHPWLDGQHGLSKNKTYIITGKASPKKWQVKELETNKSIVVPILRKYIKDIIS